MDRLAYGRGVEWSARRDGAVEDDRDARAYLAQVAHQGAAGFRARRMKAYEVALLEGKAITETDEKTLNNEAFVLVDGIAGAVMEANKHLVREAQAKSKQIERRTKETVDDEQEQLR